MTVKQRNSVIRRNERDQEYMFLIFNKTWCTDIVQHSSKKDENTLKFIFFPASIFVLSTTYERRTKTKQQGIKSSQQKGVHTTAQNIERNKKNTAWKCRIGTYSRGIWILSVGIYIQCCWSSGYWLNQERVSLTFSKK